MPQHDNEPAGEPEGRGRRAPGGAWGQLSGEARDELTRPLRVEAGRTDEPRTIERPRGRARILDRRELAPLPGEGRLADQEEPARPPREGGRRDTMPPPSPGEASPGLSAPSEPRRLADGGGAGEPPPKKRHQKRVQRQWGDARKASKRPNQTEDSP